MPTKLNLELKSCFKVTSSLYEVIFTCPAIKYIPGQYASFIIDGKYKSFSIAKSQVFGDKMDLHFLIQNLPNSRCLEIFTDSKNIGKSYLTVIPIGRLNLLSYQSNKMFICTGSGIAPFLDMISSLLSAGCKDSIMLLYGVKKLDDAYLLPLKDLNTKYSNFEFIICISEKNENDLDGSSNFNGKVTDYLNSTNIIKFSEIYLCGNPNMVENIKTLLNNNNYTMENVVTEKFINT
jgi:NAD(P)H-flavin reductase